MLSWGSMFFKFGLDDYGSDSEPLTKLQAFMRNVLDDLSRKPAAIARVRVLSVRRRGRLRSPCGFERPSGRFAACASRFGPSAAAGGSAACACGG